MKFNKFVKSIGSDGIVYERSNGDKWLASGEVFMKIPEDIRSITCSAITSMPESVEKIVDCFVDDCFLNRAIMPYPDGVIKDCIRIYSTEDRQAEVAISNAAYTLIENKDYVGMFVKCDDKKETIEGKALVVKRPFHSNGEITIGLIFPTDCEY